ncbi:MAG: alcohol dehydrogenase catalytic domain-containing protein [Phycisphaerae bacterium]|nr:alcohol dehydrogenase catalytic domain-containing protein [Phycisphaerae bacterium]
MPEQPTIPQSQHAVQLVGPGELTLTPDKPVRRPGPRQVLARIEAVGLCFSDLKLLKQFSAHGRKGAVASGLDADVLSAIPSYVPDEQPTVSGHEAVCRVVAVGEGVTCAAVGGRYLIQTDYRWLRTHGSNAAFGYNFEGALQQYVLMDERVIVDPDSGEPLLIPVDDAHSASAICLIEPWACVEDSYVTAERQALAPGGTLLVVAAAGREVRGLAAAACDGRQASVTAVVADAAQLDPVTALDVGVTRADSIDALGDATFDDIIYFGADKATIERLDARLADGGLLNVVTGGRAVGEPVALNVGRAHYGATRWIGTTGEDAAAAYAMIPETGEIRDDDSICVVGAGGPMGQMHVLRNLCSGKANLSVTASDLDDARLASLGAKAEPLARAAGAELKLLNPQSTPDETRHSYYAIMAPVPALVADAVRRAADGARINVFAGIPPTEPNELDFDAIVARGVYLFGTSGSVVRDMHIVLDKLNAGRLDTNASVDAVSGMAGAIDGIHAVENRTLAGKIIVYPALSDLPLTPLSALGAALPSVAAKLDDGRWTRAAEDELLRAAT